MADKKDYGRLKKKKTTSTRMIIYKDELAPDNQDNSRNTADNQRFDENIYDVILIRRKIVLQCFRNTTLSVSIDI